ncbi:MAG: amidohydrolase [Anaerolineae bacterium]|nr:amidohydrolase [Anaerolineae bacterium]
MAEATSMRDQIIAWRRDFHQHPEMAFEEKRTAALVAAELRDLGLEVQTGIGKTGVVAVLEGATNGPTVLVRCDMDALPITEENVVPYASQNNGVMHACGHDGHTAIGLAVAHLMHARRSQIQGRLKFVFQPAEEIAEGASAMIADGALENPKPDVALGLHLWNSVPVGKVGLTPGPSMAGADTFEIIIRGKGGHGASPHETRDPLLAAAQVVSALQSIVSRNVNPLETAVVSVTSFHSGTASNVIPPQAQLLGTIRTYTEEMHALVTTRLKTITTGIAEALGCSAEIRIDRDAPPLYNDPTVTQAVAAAISPIVRPEHILPNERTMGAEDMAVFLQHIPGCFMFVGSANAEQQLDYPHHHPRFDFDEAALPLGAALLASAIAAYVIPG